MISYCVRSFIYIPVFSLTDAIIYLFCYFYVPFVTVRFPVTMSQLSWLWFTSSVCVSTSMYFRKLLEHVGEWTTRKRLSTLCVLRYDNQLYMPDYKRGIGIYFSDHIPYPSRQSVICVIHLSGADDTLVARKRNDAVRLDLQCHSHSLVGLYTAKRFANILPHIKQIWIILTHLKLQRLTTWSG